MSSSSSPPRLPSGPGPGQGPETSRNKDSANGSGSWSGSVAVKVGTPSSTVASAGSIAGKPAKRRRVEAELGFSSPGRAFLASTQVNLLAGRATRSASASASGSRSNDSRNESPAPASASVMTSGTGGGAAAGVTGGPASPGAMAGSPVPQASSASLDMPSRKVSRRPSSRQLLRPESSSSPSRTPPTRSPRSPAQASAPAYPSSPSPVATRPSAAVKTTGAASSHASTSASAFADQGMPPPALAAAAPAPGPEEEREGEGEGEEGNTLLRRRKSLLREAQKELEGVHGDHDMLVRELFHLTKFVTLVGYDPEVARQDRSAVFSQFQEEYDLTSRIAVNPIDNRPGPSSRATRRTTSARIDSLALRKPEPRRSSGGVAGAGANASPARSVASPRARGASAMQTEEPAQALPGSSTEQPTTPARRLSSRHSFPALRNGAKDKGKGRAIDSEVDADETSAMAPPVTPSEAGRSKKPKTPRTPASEPAKEKRSHKKKPREAAEEATPSRSTKRIRIIRRIPPLPATAPEHLPEAPKFGSSVSALWASYSVLGDEEVSPERLRQIEHGEVQLRLRIDALRSDGTLPSDERDALSRRPPREPPRKKDHHDHLVEQAVVAAQHLRADVRARMQLARKVSRMILLYWERLEGTSERERKAEERRLRALAKWTVREVGKKWKLAVNVVRARKAAILKEQQERQGRRQLNAILEQSTQMLELQHADLHRADLEEEEEEEEEGASSDASMLDEAEDQSSIGEEEEDEWASDEDADRSAALELLAEEEEADARDPDGSAVMRDVEDEGGGEADPLADIVTPPRDPVALPDLSRTPAGISTDVEDDEERVARMLVDVDGETSGANEQAVRPQPAQEQPRSNGVLAEPHHGSPKMERADPDALARPRLADDRVAVDDRPTPNGPHLNGRGHRVSESRMPTTVAKATTKGKPSSTDERDPDADDIDFVQGGGGEADVEDEELERQMWAEESEEDEEEEDGLAADADMPIEELMRKYGYGAHAAESGDEEDDEENEIESGPTTPPPPKIVELDEDEKEEANGSAEAEQRDGAVDTSMATEPPQQAHEAADELSAESEDEAGSEVSTEEREQRARRSVTRASSAISVERTAPRVRPPFLLRGTLRGYQQVGFEWLASLYNNGVNGILADEMGLGKTIQTIALLAHLACDKGVWGPHLVVAPTSVMLNWEVEFKKFLPGFKILSYYGSQRERKEKRIGWNTENSFHVCITSYQLVLADQHIFRRKPWMYLILDEAHHIKNFRSQRWQTLLGFNSQRRLLLTGTPLQNNLMDLWSLMYFLMPHGISNLPNGAFANMKDFQEWFSHPLDKAVESGDQMDEETKAMVAKLHTVLRPYLLRRLKSDVEREMPKKFEHVIACRLSKRQRFLYNDFMSRAKTRETLATGNYLSIINCLMQLRKVCNHPDLFEVRPIVTSFAMQRSVVADFEIKELLVRRRLLRQDPLELPDLDVLNLDITANEHLTPILTRDLRKLDASSYLPFAKQPVPELEPLELGGSIDKFKRSLVQRRHVALAQHWKHVAYLNELRCARRPIYGRGLLDVVRAMGRSSRLLPYEVTEPDRRGFMSRCDAVGRIIEPYGARRERLQPIIDRFAFVTPRAVAVDVPRWALPGFQPSLCPEALESSFDTVHPVAVKLHIAFPDASLLQYDCGKLQQLDLLMRRLKDGGHRILIFTQMTKVLDILERFLNHHGYRYLRLDGATKVEQRQVLTEKFNRDPRIIAFILSTRSGGLGINLTGADTVLFYDLDWNAAIESQCQDRAHRIGQTRDVNIYRFVSEHTIEENMLRKANQKRMLDSMVIQEGDFTTDYLTRNDWRDMLDDGGTSIAGVRVGNAEEGGDGSGAAPTRPAGGPGSVKEIERALLAAEDEEDAAAARVAQSEMHLDTTDFSAENVAVAPPAAGAVPGIEGAAFRTTPTPVTAAGGDGRASAGAEVGEAEGEGEGEAEVGGDVAEREAEGEGDEEQEGEEDEGGTVDDYMLNFVEQDWQYFA